MINPRDQTGIKKEIRYVHSLNDQFPRAEPVPKGSRKVWPRHDWKRQTNGRHVNKPSDKLMDTLDTRDSKTASQACSFSREKVAFQQSIVQLIVQNQHIICHKILKLLSPVTDQFCSYITVTGFSFIHRLSPRRRRVTFQVPTRVQSSREVSKKKNEHMWLCTSRE